MECTEYPDIISSINGDRIIGLSEKEVNERVLKGEVNTLQKAPSRTVPQMIRANFFNIFNGLNLVLAGIVIFAGSPKNAIFALVIVVNSIIGVFQELNARKTLERLSVLSMASAKVLRSGKVKEIPIEDIVKDDILFLSVGQQVLADCILVHGNELEVDESMLTGEADPINKKAKDSLLSGSFVVAGEGYAKVLKVGKETYTSKLASEAKKFKIINSELQSSINKIIRLLLWLIVPVGIVLTITQLFYTDAGWSGALIGAVSGIVGMVPEGLVLLTSTTFIVSIIKLAKYNTLVQQLSATEGLARVDLLCLDKTGTITEGKLELSEIITISDIDIKEIEIALSAMVHNLPSKNPTQEAILNKYKEKPDVEVKEIVPFSSGRKWGGIILEKYGAWILGAPEIVLGTRYKEYSEMISERAEEGKRVLIFAKAEQRSLKLGIGKKIDEAALIIIEDIIREEAPEVLNYFKEEGVNIKVISGDNPITVSAVAMRAGVDGWDKYIDARKLPESVDQLSKVIEDYDIFGRVTPHQKKNLVKAFQKNGHMVAMTGDGVNDVLALKEADCGIAMGNGSDATKAVAQLVLLDSKFSSLPQIVAEGRQQINNLERVAELFLSKTVFYVLLAFIFCVVRLPYPILPIQSSLVGSTAIGIPSLFLAMLSFKGKVEPNFLKRILSASVPNGIIMVIFTTISYVMAYSSGVGVHKSRTVALLVLAAISLIILIRVSYPLTKLKIVLTGSMAAVIALFYIVPIGRRIFSLTPINHVDVLIAVIFAALSLPLMHIGVRISKKILKLPS